MSTEDSDPTPSVPSLASAAFTTIPFPTDHAGYAAPPDSTIQGPPDDENGDHGHSVLDFYFLLLALLILLLAILYWYHIRRRRQKGLERASRRRHALAADISMDSPDLDGRTLRPGTWAARRWYQSRYRAHVHEGLDERGEAPPPYLAKPEPAVHAPGMEGGFDMARLSTEGGKPPEYEDRRYL